MKYLACKRTVPSLGPIIKDMADFKERAQSEMAFMAKQMKNRAEELQKEHRSYWERVEKILLENDLIEKKHLGPENEKWTISISDEEQFFLKEKDNDIHPLDILRKILT